MPRKNQVISPEYRAWENMRQMCYNPKYQGSKNYLGRGITVYSEWIESFRAFHAYIGDRPSKMHSLDRIDNDGNYEPGNVRWTTWDIQANNRRGVINRDKPSSGFRGISIKPNGKYVVKGRANRSRRIFYLGTYSDLEEAISMRLTFEDWYDKNY